MGNLDVSPASVLSVNTTLPCAIREIMMAGIDLYPCVSICFM